jgi:cytochrome c oxidase subunit II
MLKRLRTTLILCLLALTGPLYAAANTWQMNMPQGVTPLSRDIYNLHMIAIYICAAIGVIVFSVMFYALFKHRKSTGHQAAVFHENVKLEVVWTLIPFFILVALAIPATKLLMRMEDHANADLTIKIVGYQWKWQYTYLENNISFFSSLSTPYQEIENKTPKNEWYLLEVDHPIVVPVHKKIRFLVTSNDVVHSWWVPDLGVKRDAIPGFMHEAWTRIEKPGIYRGQCAELCGINHGFMPIVVQAVSEEEYEQWVASMQKPKDEGSETLSRESLMKLGHQKYLEVCAACHRPDGKGMPPLYPALKGSSVAVGHPISRHIDIILYGVPGSAMQPYHEHLSDEEIAAIVTYERNAWNNNTDDVVQPKDVKEVRQSHQQEPTLVEKVKRGVPR